MIVGRLALIAAALASLFIVRALQPASAGAAIGLAIWLLLPYAALAVILRARRPRAIEAVYVATTLLVAGGGLLFLVLVVFVNSDPQGAIAVMLTPVYQAVAASLLLPVARWVVGRRPRP